MKTMRFLAAMFVAAAMFAVTGCSKDDEGGSVSKDKIEGSWAMETMTVTQTVSGLTSEYAAMNGSRTNTSGPEEGESSIFIFNNDGTVSNVNVFIDHDNNDEIVNQTSTGTWSLNGKELTLILVDEEGVTDTMVLNVEEVTSNKLVLTTERSMDDSTSIPGQVATITVSIKLDFSRV